VPVAVFSALGLGWPGLLGATSAQLAVINGKLVTAVGNCPVVLKGVNVPGLEYSETGSGPSGSGSNGNLTSVEVAVTQWGANLIRLPLDQDRWMGTACAASTSAAAYQQIVENIVNWCNANNVYVLLDLHWSDLGVAGSGNVCGGATSVATALTPVCQTYSSGQHDMPDDNSTLFWQSVASQSWTQNNPAVLFDLYNEPGGANLPTMCSGSSGLNTSASGWALWRNGGEEAATADGTAYHTPGMQGLMNTIRAAGANNVIVAGGINWAFDLRGLAWYNDWLTDTATGHGVIYATHIYPWKAGSYGCASPGCGCDTASSFELPVEGVLGVQPIIVSEFGPYVSGSTTDPDQFVPNILPWINGGNSAGIQLNFTAWCMNTGDNPPLLSSWSYNASSPSASVYTPNTYFGKLVLASLTSTAGGGCLPTATPSVSPTFTSSPTFSETPTISPTFTPSPTFSASPTATPSFTSSPSFTISPTFTASPTITQTPTPQDGPAAILDVLAFPNPNPVAIAVRLYGNAAQIQVAVYSRAFVRVGAIEGSNLGPGWVKLPVPAELSAKLVSGVYFLKTSLPGNGQPPVLASMMVTKR